MVTRFYLVKIEWYSDYTEKEVTTYSIVGAASAPECINKIYSRFENICEVTMRALDEDEDFIFLNETYYEKFYKEGNEALDPDEDFYNFDKSAHTNPEDTYREDFGGDI